MKQVVFLLDSYHPYYSAVSRCLGNLAEVLEGDYQITVICQKDRPEQAEREQFGEQKLIRIGTFWSKMRLCVEQNLRLCGKKASAETENAAKESIKKASEKKERAGKESAEKGDAEKRKAEKRDTEKRKVEKGSGRRRQFWNMALQCLRAVGVGRMVCSRRSLDSSLVQAYVRALESVDADILIPTCIPFETVAAALEYKKKHPSVLLTPFLFDKFADNARLHRFDWNRKLKRKANQHMEEQMLILSEKIFHVSNWTAYFQEFFPQYAVKTCEVEHPLLCNPVHAEPTAPTAPAERAALAEPVEHTDSVVSAPSVNQAASAESVGLAASAKPVEHRDSVVSAPPVNLAALAEPVGLAASAEPVEHTDSVVSAPSVNQAASAEPVGLAASAEPVEHTDSVVSAPSVNLAASAESVGLAPLVNQVNFADHADPIDQADHAGHADQADRKGVLCFVYAGVVDHINRNPRHFLDIMALLYQEEGQKSPVFHCFTGGSAQFMMDEAASRYPNIISHGFVPASVAHSALVGADVLVSLGNRDITQFPSKIIDYLALGKPIVHLVQTHGDPVEKMLSDYPLALCLSASDAVRENAAHLLLWCRQHRETLPFSQIEEQFYTMTPRYIAELFTACWKN